MDDVVQFGIGHAGVKGERDTAAPVAFNIGKVLGTQLVAFLVIGHVVQRLVMHGKTDLTGHPEWNFRRKAANDQRWKWKVRAERGEQPLKAVRGVLKVEIEGLQNAGSWASA